MMMIEKGGKDLRKDVVKGDNFHLLSPFLTLEFEFELFQYYGSLQELNIWKRQKIKI